MKLVLCFRDHSHLSRGYIRYDNSFIIAHPFCRLFNFRLCAVRFVVSVPDFLFIFCNKII